MKPLRCATLLLVLPLTLSMPAFAADPGHVDLYVTPYYDSNGPVIKVGQYSSGLASPNAADFVDTNVARGLGDKVAFADGERTLAYGELQDASLRFAAALRGLGLRAEERVALILPDTVDYPVAFWGAVRASRGSGRRHRHAFGRIRA